MACHEPGEWPEGHLSYDALNRVTSMVDAVGTTVYAYDAVGQVLSEDGPWTDDTVSYTYTNRLRIGMSLLSPDGTAWGQSYAYDLPREIGPEPITGAAVDRLPAPGSSRWSRRLFISRGLPREIGPELVTGAAVDRLPAPGSSRWPRRRLISRGLPREIGPEPIPGAAVDRLPAPGSSRWPRRPFISRGEPKRLTNTTSVAPVALRATPSALVADELAMPDV
jgi:YD repeat-containing protein